MTAEKNYWGDYQERYPDAMEVGNSGIWNTSYAYSYGWFDNHPLMNPVFISELPQELPTPMPKPTASPTPTPKPTQTQTPTPSPTATPETPVASQTPNPTTLQTPPADTEEPSLSASAHAPSSPTPLGYPALSGEEEPDLTVYYTVLGAVVATVAIAFVVASLVYFKKHRKKK